MDGAGKSTLLQTILGAEPEKTMPTFGFNNESMSRAGFDVDLFDLGGGKRIRGIWKAYMADVHGCIFVVDSAAEDRLHECREVFAETLRDPHLSGKPIVVFANKQDLPTAKSAAEIAEGLGLTTLQNARHHIVPCTALRRSADEARLLPIFSQLRPQITRAPFNLSVFSSFTINKKHAFPPRPSLKSSERGRVWCE